MRAPRYAVVLTHNRPDLLDGCVEAIAPQADVVIVVDNASDPPTRDDGWPPNVVVKHIPDQPPNLSRLWNQQLDAIAALEEPFVGMHPAVPGVWDVALLCDDVVVPPDWYDRVATGLREWGAAAASAHSYEPSPASYLLTDLTNGADRMCPWCFMLPGEKGLRADETLRWWYCDTDVDWQARRTGGTVIVAGAVAPNLRVGEYTATKPELGEQAGHDAAAFHAKWGL